MQVTQGGGGGFKRGSQKGGGVWVQKGSQRGCGGSKGGARGGEGSEGECDGRAEQDMQMMQGPKLQQPTSIKNSHAGIHASLHSVFEGCLHGQETCVAVCRPWVVHMLSATFWQGRGRGRGLRMAAAPRLQQHFILQRTSKHWHNMHHVSVIVAAAAAVTCLYNLVGNDAAL